MVVIEEGIETTTISAAIWRTDSATGGIGAPYWLGLLWGGHGTTCASAEMSMACSDTDTTNTAFEKKMSFDDAIIEVS